MPDCQKGTKLQVFQKGQSFFRLKNATILAKFQIDIEHVAKHLDVIWMTYFLEQILHGVQQQPNIRSTSRVHWEDFKKPFILQAGDLTGLVTK